MRIIGGTHRGRPLAAPEGLGTRPMTDRVRENLFNILAGEVPGAVVLDLFAGSGALGLEALSRGAALAAFVEQGRRALEAVSANCRTLGVEDVVRIHRRDALRPGPWLAPPGGERFTLIFCDPPYKLAADPAGRASLARMAEALGRLALVAPGATAMLRAERGTAVADHPWPGFQRVDERTYGTTTLHLMQADPESEAPGP